MLEKFQEMFGMLSIPFSIGQFVIEWNQTERNLIRLMAILEQDPPNGISDDVYFEARDKWLDVNSNKWSKPFEDLLARFANTDIAPDLDEIVRQLPIALKLRHDVVHGYYGGVFDDGTREFKRKPRKADHFSERISGQTIWGWINQVLSLNSIAGRLEIRIKTGGPVHPINSQS